MAYEDDRSETRNSTRRSRSHERKYEGQSRSSPDRVSSKKRDRSLSRGEPRKRRSLSPRDDRTRGHDRERRRDRKHDTDSDDRRHRAKKHWSRSRSRSPRRRQERLPEPFKRSKAPLPSQQDAFENNDEAVIKADPAVEKQKPNFGNTGRLAAASNTVQTGGKAIILKYHEPAEARKPPSKENWRMYVFKGDDIIDTIELAQQSCWLFGREAAIVDVVLEHSSCSKQHAVIQFRFIEKRNEFGDKIGKVKPYILDLESPNQTLVNDHAIPQAKYVEVRDKDMIKFGHSSREFVMVLPPAS